jgi:hypothetical protein
VNPSCKQVKEDPIQPELHSRFASERLKDDHGARPDDPTDESLIEVHDDLALLPRALPPGEDD